MPILRRLKNSGYLVLLTSFGASTLSSCGGLTRPDFSTGSGGGDGDSHMGGAPGDGDSGKDPGDGDGDGDSGGTAGDGDGDNAGAAGDGDGDGDLECPEGTADCNGDPADGCEVELADLKAPKKAVPLRPFRGAYTGSVHASKAEDTLRPVFEWSEAESTNDCGPIEYTVELDASCVPGELDSCSFDAIRHTGVTEENRYQPDEDLRVSMSAPVGAFYAWRVIACDRSGLCSTSDVSHLHVGRTLQDINGDGYGDSMVLTDDATEVFYGGDESLAVSSGDELPKTNFGRFVGDLNSDGFADVAMWLASNRDGLGCADVAGYVPVIYFGSQDLSKSSTQAVCGAAGSASTQNLPRDVGDINGDGFDDLGVSWDFGSMENLLRVFPGGPEVGSTAIADVETVHNNYTLSIVSGQNVVGRGDYDGDGYSDVLAGGVQQTNPNEIYVMKGGREFISSFAHTFAASDCQTTQWISSAGDVNSDGLDDFAVVCALSGGGSSFFVIQGGSDSPDDFANTWEATEKDFVSVTPFLDFDNNGEREFFIGLKDGRAIIWRMDESEETDPMEFIRHSQSGWIDVADNNGNGRLDLLLGGPTGAAWVGSSTSFAVLAHSLTFNSTYGRLQF